MTRGNNQAVTHPAQPFQTGDVLAPQAFQNLVDPPNEPFHSNGSAAAAQADTAGSSLPGSGGDVTGNGGNNEDSGGGMAGSPVEEQTLEEADWDTATAAAGTHAAAVEIPEDTSAAAEGGGVQSVRYGDDARACHVKASKRRAVEWFDAAIVADVPTIMKVSISSYQCIEIIISPRPQQPRSVANTDTITVQKSEL